VTGAPASAARAGSPAPLAVLTPREAAVVASLADTIAAPEPPLPPVAETDAVAAFDRWLVHAPALNRLALRAVLYPAAARLRRRDRTERVAALRELDRSRVPGVRQLTEAVRAAVAACYFGDTGVMRLLGYDADAVVERGRRLRREEGRG
jgi:hypothetical protein